MIMGNPFNSINPANPYNANNMAGIRGMYQMLTQSPNPMQAFQQLARQNPRLKPIADMLARGASPRSIFNDMCRQKGINPDEFIRNITGK